MIAGIRSFHYHKRKKEYIQPPTNNHRQLHND